MQVIRFSLVLCLLQTSAFVQAAEFIALGDLPGGSFQSRAFGVSADGSVVVGASFSDVDFEPFRWTERHGMERLDNILAVITPGSARDVSANGSVVVGEAHFGNAEAFRWTSPTFRMLSDLPGEPFSSRAEAVSADGSVVVGTGNFQGGGGPIPVTGEAFRWTEADGLVGLGDLPGGQNCSRAYDVSADGTVVVGKGDCGATFQVEDLGTAFRWTAETGMVSLGHLLEDPSGFQLSTALAVSADGTTVVGGSDSGLGFEAFHWHENERMHGLGHLPGDTYSLANDVSGDGATIVGTSGERAFLWTQSEGMQDLITVLIDSHGLDLKGWTLSAATAINASATSIVGYGINPAGQTEAWIVRLGNLSVPGDTNGDGIVNADDLNNVRNNFGATGTNDGTLAGDAVPWDGIVNIDDLNGVRNNFGAGAVAVPEPTTLALASLFAFVAFITRRWRG